MRPLLTALALSLVLAVPLAPPTHADTEVPGSQAQMQLSFAPVVKAAAPAVVNIYAKRVVAQRVSPFADDPFFSQFFTPYSRSVPRVQNSLGSGVIVSPDGLVVSNHHVVGDASEIRVVLSDRREFDGEILLSDPESDVAIIRLQEAADLPALTFGDSDAAEVGDLVLAIGNPFGVGQTVSSGIVSGLARSGGVPGLRDSYFLQTDAPINPGNSGGALVDMAGRLIGINTAILTRSGGSNGIGFAIPANLVRQYVTQAQDGATRFARPWAGMELQPVDAALAEALDQPVPRGLLVTRLHDQSAFARAGLRPGDILMALDGLPTDAPVELDYRLATRGPGRAVTAQLHRKGQDLQVDVVLEIAPDTPTSPPQTITARTPFNGLTVAELTPRLLEDLNLGLEARGAVVVAARGPAQRSGLRPGDIITGVNGTPVTDPEQLARLLSQRASGWDLRLRRDDRDLVLRLRG
ncbi:MULTISPECIES: trypsin-like peptidase domain-containing protein [unclassified Meridianimarinicoccus]|uniref:trypsin-like peptidase domain-containing protein n=1 Tax=unclassified Meridianimarinicoccus TaxID=2923344 RepID=UPI001866566A|nr:trypsin-like peptidase domain-containing protein [Fluviibacterium sp. MJW13]